MVKFTRDSLVDVDLYEQRIRQNGYIVYDRESMELGLDYLQSLAKTEASFAKDVMMHKSGSQYFLLNKDAVYAFLTRCEHCPDRYFNNRKVESISLDMKHVLQKLLANGYAKEFLTHYCNYRSFDNKSNNIKSIITQCRTECGHAKDGTPLYRIPYNVNRQKNLRFNYKSFDIIAQIPKEFCTDIKVEDGYFLAWGDFAQSDFRIAYNLFLRSKENDEIMNKYQDKYEALTRIVARDNGVEFDYETFKLERPIYKRMTLKTMYGTRNSAVKEEQEFIQNFSKFLMKQPKYSEYYHRLERRCELNLPIVLTSYFGNQESIPIFSTSKEDTINNALNSPIQTGTSEIVILTCNSILDKFYELGYTPEDVSIYITRHDEPIFKIKDSVLKDIWVLEQHKDILVDDWSPLHLDFSFGYSYKVEDEELTNLAKQYIEANRSRINQLQPGSDIDTSYYPVQDVFQLFVHYVKTEQGTVAAFYNAQRNEVEYKLIDSLEDDEISLAIKSSVRELSTRAYDFGYRGMIVYSNFFNGEDFYDRTYVLYKLHQSVIMDPVVKLCKYMTCRFCKSKEIDCPVEPPMAEDAEWIYGVKGNICKEN